MIGANLWTSRCHWIALSQHPTSAYPSLSAKKGNAYTIGYSVTGPPLRPKLIARSSKECLPRPGRLSWSGTLSTSEKYHGSMTRLFDHIGPERLPLEKTRVIESPWLPISLFASVTVRREFLPAGIRPRLHEEELIWQSDS